VTTLPAPTTVNLVTDRDPVAVEEDAVVVDEGAGADRDIVAIVAAEARLHDSALAEVAERRAWIL
jgi:hypothetical protein